MPAPSPRYSTRNKWRPENYFIRCGNFRCLILICENQRGATLAFWQALDRSVNLFAMKRSTASASTELISLRQRQRRRPSRVKSTPQANGTPSENLKLAMELSDLCLSLRDAGRKKP